MVLFFCIWNSTQDVFFRGISLFLLRSRLCTREHRRGSNTRGVQHWSGRNIELKDMLNFGAVVLCWKYATFRLVITCSCFNLGAGPFLHLNEGQGGSFLFCLG